MQNTMEPCNMGQIRSQAQSPLAVLWGVGEVDMEVEFKTVLKQSQDAAKTQRAIQAQSDEVMTSIEKTLSLRVERQVVGEVRQVFFCYDRVILLAEEGDVLRLKVMGQRTDKKFKIEHSLDLAPWANRLQLKELLICKQLQHVIVVTELEQTFLLSLIGFDKISMSLKGLTHSLEVQKCEYGLLRTDWLAGRGLCITNGFTLRVYFVEQGKFQVAEKHFEYNIKNVFMDSQYVAINFEYYNWIQLRDFRNLDAEVSQFYPHVSVTAFNWIDLQTAFMGSEDGSLYVLVSGDSTPVQKYEQAHSDRVLKIRQTVLEGMQNFFTLSSQQLIIYIREEETLVPSRQIQIVSLGMGIIFEEKNLLLVTYDLNSFSYLEVPHKRDFRQVHWPWTLPEVTNKMLYPSNTNYISFIKEGEYVVADCNGNLFHKQQGKGMRWVGEVGAGVGPRLFYIRCDESGEFCALVGRQNQQFDNIKHSVRVVKGSVYGEFRPRVVFSSEERVQLIKSNNMAYLMTHRKHYREVRTLSMEVSSQNFVIHNSIPEVLSLATDSKGSLFISAYKLWRSRRQSPTEYTVMNRKAEVLLDLTVSEDETLLLCSNKKGFLKIFDLQTEAMIRKIRFSYSTLGTVKSLKDGLFAVKTFSSVIIWSERWQTEVYRAQVDGKIAIDPALRSIVAVADKEELGPCVTEHAFLPLLREQRPRAEFSFSLRREVQSLDFLQLFSLDELIRLRQIYSDAEIADLQFLTQSSRMKKYYFNEAIYFGKTYIVEHFLARGYCFMLPDHIFLQTDPISYCLEHNRIKISQLLIAFLELRNVYDRMFYAGEPEFMKRRLMNFFEPSRTSGALPEFADIRSGVIAINSFSPHNYRADRSRIRLATDSEEVHPLRVVKLSRALEVTPGCPQIYDLLHAFEQYVDEDVLHSDAALFLEHLWNRNHVFFVVQSLVSTLLLGFQVFAVVQQDHWSSVLGLCLLAPLVLYQVLTFYSWGDYLGETSNKLDIIVIILNLVTHALFLSDSSPPFTLNYFTVLATLARVLFNLRVIQPLRHFLFIFKEIFSGILSFAVVTAVGLVSFVLTGMVTNNNFSKEIGVVLNAVIFGEVNANIDMSDKDFWFAAYLNVFLRQLLMSIFFLNGILVGIVTGIYDKGESEKELIFFREKLSAIKDFETFEHNRKRLSKLLFGRKSPRYFTHLLVTGQPEPSFMAEQRAKQLGKVQIAEESEQYYVDDGTVEQNVEEYTFRNQPSQTF